MTAQEHAARLPERLPVMPMRSTTVYPTGVVGLQIGMESTLEMIAAQPEGSLHVALVLAPGEPDEPIERASLEKIGVFARISDRLNLPGGTVQATVQGLRRLRLARVDDADGYFTAEVEPVTEVQPTDDRAAELITKIVTTLDALASEVDRISGEVTAILRMNTADPGRFADLVATLANFSAKSKDRVLDLLDVEERLGYILGELQAQLARVRHVEEAEEEAGRREQEEPESPAERAQALRSRIKRMQAQLGEIDPSEREAVDLLRRIEAADLPGRIAGRARSEVERLRTVRATSTEASSLRTYIDWLLNMPWQKRAAADPESIDLSAVQEELDAAVLGLEDPKDRLLDYLAVAKLRRRLHGRIPCIVGPPDVGKNSLVRALARSLERPLATLQLGGRNEDDLAGIRRTRSDAEPGKIVEAIREAGVMDPVFLLEEMDQVGLGKLRGDPIEVMEEALEWDGRTGFIDRYIDLPFDLSEAFFVATARDFYRVPRALREQMVEIRIAGYTPEEKVRIARERLLPRLLEENGLDPDDIELDDDALFYVARGYTRDAGLGMSLRALGILLRTRARAKAQGDEDRWTFDSSRITDILGQPRYIATPAESAPEVGVVTGLAWTRSGGQLMSIEALRMPGSGRLIITGRLGDVMRESVNAAYSYVRSRGGQLDIPEDLFHDADVHVHFPIGAMPKDGPSAGVAVTLAIASTLSDRPVRHDIVMTGEVTLRGKVLEVGGIKEKVLAAYREDITRIILPERNERDLRDVPDDVREAIDFELVESMDEVIDLALLDRDAAGRGDTAGRRRSRPTPRRPERRAAKE